MRGHVARCLLVAVTTGCGAAEAPARAPESTAFVQDPTRPNIVHGIDGTLDGAPEVGMKDGHDLTVDGSKVGGELGPALQQKKSASGRVAFALDRDTPWSTVRPLLDAAAKSGHAHASFVTRVVKKNVSRPGHLDVEVATEKKNTTGRELHISVSARGAVMMKWMEGTKQLGDVVSGDAAVARLAPLIERGWNEKGLYHEANDKRRDQIVLRVEPETAYILVLTVLDAISATKRDDAPAFVVNLRIDDAPPSSVIGAHPADKPH